jgi:glycosyltransferase involved in cell wall biosynthesis
VEVTVSIINYNYGRFLKQSIESALSQQTTAVFEVLVIDDGSTDESDEIIASFAGKENFRFSKTENRGFAASLTRAITEAKGEYIFLLDADDFFKPGKVEVVLPFLQKGYLYVSDRSSYVNEEGNPIAGKAFGSTSCVAVSAVAAEHLLPVENELSFYSFYKLGRGIILDDAYTQYRLHGKSMTNRRIPGKQNEYLSRITHNLSNQLQVIAESNVLSDFNVPVKSIKKVARYFRAQAYYNQLEAALEIRNQVKALNYFLHMLYWNMRVGNWVSLFLAKMFIRTLLRKPSQPK